MSDGRARSRSVSIPTTSNPSLNPFSGRGHSLVPLGPKSEQVSFPSVQTTTTGTTTASSNWKTLSNPFRSSRTKSMAVPRATEVFQTTEVIQASPRQRTIVRKSLRIPEITRTTAKTSSPVKGKTEEVDSDDEGTLVSVSVGEIPVQNNEVKEKKLLAEDKRPVTKSLRVSQKILPMIPDLLNDKDDVNRSPVQEPQEKVLYTRKSQHWGLRSSPYQPEFIIEKEGEKDVETQFTSLSPPPNVYRRQSAITPRRT